MVSLALCARDTLRCWLTPPGLTGVVYNTIERNGRNGRNGTQWNAMERHGRKDLTTSESARDAETSVE